MPRNPVLVVFFMLLVPPLPAQTSWFPFALPWEDNSKSAIDASDLLVDYSGQDPAVVIDSRGFLRAGADGHFYWEKTGGRARFWGVNFTFNANFPPCPDEPLRAGEFSDIRAADKIARRLAKLGVNVVRFHHMDTSPSPDGIWDRAYYPLDTQHLDPAQMKRLDWLIYQLRLNGIYVNLNLKVGRRFGPNDGIEDSAQFTGSLNYFQGVSHFNRRMIDLQQDYARKLLAHRNPYTGRTYAEDPVLAFVEIANEDSVFGNMLNDGGLNYLPGVSGSLPEQYSLELDTLWNSWLAQRYSSRTALESAWKSTESAGDTSNRIRNWDFENGTSEWSIYPIESAGVQARTVAGSGPDGSSALRIDVTSDGTNWHVQATQGAHSVEKDKAYEFSFYARASVPGEITIDLMKGAEPWSNYGLSKSVQLTTSWQRFVARFTANATDPITARPTFELGEKTATIWLDKIEFRATVPKGLEADESYTAGNVRRPIRSDLGAYTPQRVADLFRFYSTVDESYFSGMRSFLKGQIGVKTVITGTAPWWAYLGDVATQSKLDYVDGHYYWDHPSWPAGREWQPTGWQINNKPWINQIEDFSSLASQAVEGKPFTVSEFNEVFPNRYALEGPLLAALIANLQDWDAFYMFDYAGSARDFAALYTSSFFSQSGNPIKSAQLPICSRIFLGRQTATASTTVAVELNRDELAAGYAKGLVSASGFLESKGLDRRTFLKERLRIRTFERVEPATVDHSLPAGNVISANRELRWNRDNPEAGYLVIKGLSLQGAVGFIKTGIVDLGDWDFEVGDSSPSHMAILLQARDGVALRETRRMILSVWTEHQNTGMTWNASQTSVDNRWGTSPTIIRPAQVDVTFRFAGARSLRLFPLDERGARKIALPADAVGDSRRFHIDTGRDGTVWYEIEINDAASSLDFVSAAPGVTQVHTDPRLEQWQAGWTEIENQSGPALRPTVLLEYSTRGVLTSVVRMPSSSPKTTVRVPVIKSPLVDTALALLNQQAGANEISMQLLDTNGTAVGTRRTALLDPGKSIAFFISQQFDLGSSFEGLIELESNLPFHALTLRSITNAAGDFSLTPYPPESTSSGPLYFAHLAADSSYSTDILLWNSQGQAVTARLDLFAPGGEPTGAAGQPASSQISLLPGQMRRITLGRGDTSFYGYARLTPVSGAALPSNTAVITRWENGSPVSEAGIPATLPLRDELQLLAERADQRNALALLNPSISDAIVDIELIGAESPVEGSSTVSISLRPGEKRAFFLYQIFPDMPSNATGVVRVKANTEVASLSLLGITNQRGEFLMASITWEPGRDPLAAGDSAVLPRVVTGGGYRTNFYLLPASLGSMPSQGRFRFTSAAGEPLPLLFR